MATKKPQTTIKVNRVMLLEKLKKRLEDYDSERTREIENWREETIKRLTEMLEEVKTSESINTRDLRSYATSYYSNPVNLKRAIAALELSSEESVDVTSDSTYIDLLV